MDQDATRAAVREISAEGEPVLKMLKLASLCSAVCRERAIEVVVVGGSAIELFTDGAYVSGDLDLCLANPSTLSLRQRQELMGELGGQGGPRSWQLAGMYVDLLGRLETLARTPLRNLSGPYGIVRLVQPEELLVERILVSVYPVPSSEARDSARKLAAVALGGAVELDWNEVERLAGLAEYRILPECKSLLREVANELKIKSPVDSN